MMRKHEMPFGAECRVDGSVHFRLWAPKAKSVSLQLLDSQPHEHDMRRNPSGWFELCTEEAQAGSKYRFVIDDQLAVPDPASRFQSLDVRGPSEVVDPLTFSWHDADWQGRSWEEAVIYELHVGTFSQEGTYLGAERKLDYLAELGVTAIELMPLSSFPGERNWGYDGVLPYAPARCYGRPEDLKRFIEKAHARNLMVLLDVVYNHFGPEGNYLWLYAPQFFSERHHTPWGQAINFDGPNSRIVRDYFIHNALYWLEEYHFDGLRFDAVHAIVDDSCPDILIELAETVRSKFSGTRHIHLVLENDHNAARYLQREAKGCPRRYDAQWNDDFHHALQVMLTAENNAHFADYAEAPARFLGRCLAEGFGYQGEASRFRKGALRGEPSRKLPLSCFVDFLQNHDQVGNRAFGERIVELVEAPVLKAAMAVLLLSPSIPLLFMGEEYGATTPFLFFCDFGPELAAKVIAGRRSEFPHPERCGGREIADPGDKQTFLRSKLDWTSLEQPNHQGWLRFYRELLICRREEISPRLKAIVPGSSEYNVLSPCALQVEWQLDEGGRLEVLANLGHESLKLEKVSRGRVFYTNTEMEPISRPGELAPYSVIWLVS